jgi:hypothetical protein
MLFSCLWYVSLMSSFCWLDGQLTYLDPFQTLDRIAQLWDRLKTWERSLEQTRLRSPVRLTFDKVASVLQVLVSAKGNPSTSMVRCSEDGSLSISSSN